MAGAEGFTLVELAVVMIIAALVLAAVVALLLPLISAARTLETREKMNKISDALAVYAVSNNRLPCPAEAKQVPASTPFGYEDGSGANGTGVPSPVCPRTQGIVPFRTLGLPGDMAMDGWGNYFTYAVSPSFAQDTASGNPQTVHPVCRTRDWVYTESFNADGSSVVANRNPSKARFCCPPDIAGDITVIDEEVVGNSVIGFPRNPGPDGWQRPEILMRPVDTDAGGFDPVACTGGDLLRDTDANYLVVPQVPPECARSTDVAYVLISHGQNGSGAYNISTGTPLDVPASPLEMENADGDSIFREHIWRSDTGDAKQMDDIVLWRTQDMIFAAQGETCLLP